MYFYFDQIFRYLPKYLNMNSIFKALNDPTRRKILDLLKTKDLSAGEIATHFNISKPSISHHLDILKRSELITSDKQGQFIIYSINTTVLEEIIQWIYQLKQNNHEISTQQRNSNLGIDSVSDSISHH